MSDKYPLLDACNPITCFSGRIMRIERIIANVFRDHIAAFGLTNSQLSILFFTAKKGIVTQIILSDALFLEKSSVSRNMKRLLDANLIQKINTRQIEMTHTGKTLLEEIIPEWEKAMIKVNALLEPEGEQAFDLVYDKLTNNKL